VSIRSREKLSPSAGARRRIAVAIATLPLLLPAVSRAQSAGVPRIGFLPLGSPSNAYDQSLVEAFRQGLREAGLMEGKHFTLDLIWVDTDAGYARAASELVQRGAKLLVPAGTSASVAVKAQSSTIPIVFVTVGDPVGVKLVDNLSRPGGNATGFSDVLLDLSGKYVDLAKELGNPPTTVYYLWYTQWANGQSRLQASVRAAAQTSVKLRAQGIGDIGEVDQAVASLKREGAAVIIVQPSPFTYRHRSRIIDSASSQGVGTIFGWPIAAREGAVVAYGPDYADLYRRAAGYVAKILQGGARPGDLPVEQPTKFEMVVNLKTARALNLTVPQSVMLQAHDVVF
jgi:putative ABC transport system substrate-binding protein